MEVEEHMVKRTLHPAGLNMIPGGFEGVKFLHQHGFLRRQQSSLDERDHTAAQYLKQQGALGKIAPWVSQSWARDDFYEQVIFKRQNTLNRDQVHAIRKYGNEWGFAADVIANLVGANVRQVRDVLRGKYYARVQSNEAKTASDLN